MGLDDASLEILPSIVTVTLGLIGEGQAAKEYTRKKSKIAHEQSIQK